MDTDNASSVVELLSLENPVLRVFAFWGGLLILKMGLMSFLPFQQARLTKVGHRWF